jgi:hypothetical protein
LSGVANGAAAGINKSTVLRHIKAGKISATRDDAGGWQIDPAEFHRLFPPLKIATDHPPRSNATPPRINWLPSCEPSLQTYGRIVTTGERRPPTGKRRRNASSPPRNNRQPTSNRQKPPPACAALGAGCRRRDEGAAEDDGPRLKAPPRITQAGKGRWQPSRSRRRIRSIRRAHEHEAQRHAADLIPPRVSPPW